MASLMSGRRQNRGLAVRKVLLFGDLLKAVVFFGGAKNKFFSFRQLGESECHAWSQEAPRRESFPRFFDNGETTRHENASRNFRPGSGKG